MGTITTTTVFASLGLLAATSAVRADPYVVESEPTDSGFSWHDERLRTGIGVGVILGGGISGFTDQTMRNTVSSQIAGLWDARVSIGTHLPLALDINYVGMAANINSLGTANGTLLGTSTEAMLRFNLAPHAAWDPYVFAGVGWQRYDVTNMQVATSDSGIKSSDNVADFPMGVGMAYRDPSGWLLDLRGTYRPTTSSTLVLDPNTGAYANLNSWEASGALGYEF